MKKPQENQDSPELEKLIGEIYGEAAQKKDEEKELAAETIEQLWKGITKGKMFSSFEHATWYYQWKRSRLWLDERRRITRRNKLISAITEEQKWEDREAASPPNPENILLAAERRDKARALLEELSKNPTDREVLRLRKEDYSTKEIAEKLGLTERAVRLRIHRMKKKLKTRGVSLSDLI